jgi:hypothetical protein
MEPDGLPDAPAGSIAGDRSPDLPAGADANPGPGRPPRARKGHQVGAGVKAAPREQALKVTPSGQPKTLFHRTCAWPGGQARSARAQPGSALAATILNYPSATHRAHALHEPVDPAPVAFLGLICPLDFSRPLFFALFSAVRVLCNPFRLNSRSIRNRIRGMSNRMSALVQPDYLASAPPLC